MEDKNPYFDVTRSEFTSTATSRQQMYEKFDKGKGVSEARKQGFELIDEGRLLSMLRDLEKEGLIDLMSGNPAPRGMEILRG